ncbi:Acyltransferase OPGC1, partial [Operophtera brumata]
MPALSELDDFDLCLKKPDAVYCIVDMVLLEDETPLYQFIKNFSSLSYTNYMHSKLHRGVCASKACGLNLTHANASDATAAALQHCFNQSIHQGLPVDALDFTIGALLLLLLLVNLGCSAFYFFWPGENGKDNRFMMAFCVQKNWKALKHGGSAEGGLFKCFQALSLLFNARVIVQIFFVMGGFLMAYKMLVYAESHQFSLKTVPMALVNRWLRLMPAVLVIMGLAMTWVPHLGSGPMWDAVVKRERDLCRTNWWQLVILMPNLFPFEHLCMPQA